jgi:hypothetical protein
LDVGSDEGIQNGTMGFQNAGAGLLAVAMLGWLAACQVSPSPAPRHFTDALGRTCSQNFVTSIPYQCQEQGLGSAPSCPATPAPDGGCMGATPCWVLDMISVSDGGAGDAEPIPSRDGGAASVAALCPGCCSGAGSTIIDDTSGCGAIACKTVADCPFENCCVDGWCQ